MNARHDQSLLKRSRWSTVTEKDSPQEVDALPFDLTAAERTRAALAACEIERARRKANERDAHVANLRPEQGQ